VTGDFVGAWTEWYLSQEDNPPFQDDRFSGYFERRPTHVMKLSMIFNAARTDSMIVDKGDLLDAIKFVEETEIKMPRTFSGVGRSSHADLLPRIIAFIGNAKSTTYAELMTRFMHDATKWDLDRILETLEAMKVVQLITNTGEIRYVGGDDAIS